MNPVILSVQPDGSVQCLYTEVIDLAALGQLRIERATTIEFDNPAHVWRVFNRKGRGVYSAASRQECLRWEAEHLAEPLAGD